MHTTSSAGADSVYKTTYAGSGYVFYIDQLTCDIYNVDSLPKGTDVAHVITTINTKNGGTAVWKSAISDTLTAYSSTDSVNLQDGKVYVYGKNGDEDVCYSTAIGDGRNWASDNMPETETVNTADMTLSDNKYAPWLPTQDMSLVRLPKVTNTDANQLVLVGNRSVEQYPDDQYAVVWGKVEETAAGSENQPWIYYEHAADNHYLLPRLQHLQVVKYGDQMLALGGSGIGACTVAAFKQLYASRDGGITWKIDSRFALPAGFAADEQSFAMTVDENHYLWIVCGGSGQVWRGRLSQLGWATQQKVF